MIICGEGFFVEGRCRSCLIRSWSLANEVCIFKFTILQIFSENRIAG